MHSAKSWRVHWIIQTELYADRTRIIKIFGQFGVEIWTLNWNFTAAFPKKHSAAKVDRLNANGLSWPWRLIVESKQLSADRSGSLADHLTGTAFSRAAQSFREFHLEKIGAKNFSRRISLGENIESKKIGLETNLRSLRHSQRPPQRKVLKQYERKSFLYQEFSLPACDRILPSISRELPFCLLSLLTSPRREIIPIRIPLTTLTL